MYNDQPLPVREHVASNHAAAINAYAEPGTWLDAETRLAVLKEVRAAVQCNLCATSRAALSPYSTPGSHDAVTTLSQHQIEIVHRIRTDSGRLTRKWFDAQISAGVSAEEYIEIVGLVATSIIIDSFSVGLGTPLAEPPSAQPGEPSRESNPAVIEGGAWVPLLDVPQEPTEVVLPTAPNIFRAMGLVPGAIAHFFNVMRSQYSLTEYDISLSRSQVELLAARVSALNQCFY